MSAAEEETLVETEELVEESPSEEVVDEVSEESPEYSEIQLEAMEQGWNPEGAEGKRNLTAEEFLDRKPLYDKMHKQDKQIKELKKQFDALREHEKMVRDRMHEDHVKELKQAKREALENFEYDKAEEIDDEIYKARKEHEDAGKAVVAEATSPEEIQATLEDWVSKNDWYTSNLKMKRFAEGEGQDFRNANPDASFDDVLEHISKTVKKEFPEEFQNMNRTKPSSVEGSAQGAKRAPTAPKQKTVKDLPEEAIPVMKTLVRAGAFKSEQDYVNDYFS